jgi:hypothetical protein
MQRGPRDNDIFGTGPVQQSSNQRKAQIPSRGQDNDIFGQNPSHENVQRKAQIQNRRDNDIFGTGPVNEPTHKTQAQNRNASSFNIIGFDPNSPVSNNKGDQLMKKEKQNQYRDELNQMVHDKQGREPTNKIGQGRGNIETVGSDYGNYYGHNQQGSNKYQEDLYSQQYQRGGEGYQQAQNYNRQVEDDRAQSEQDKKRKLQQEMFLENKKAVEEKQALKKRQSEMDAYEDSRRLRDALNQHEREDFSQKESKKRLQEENTQFLNQQRADFKDRKNAQAVDKLSYDMGGMNIGDPLRERQQAEPHYSQSEASAKSDYIKNRDKNRYGGNFNIINNEYN